MTKLFLRLFVKNYEQTDTPAVRAGVGRLSGIVGILSNAVLFAGKLAAGILSGSVSVTADAMNNLSDGVSAIVTLIGFRLAGRPADADHPYGHARYEYLSGLAVAAMIVVIGFELAKSSVEKIVHPVAVAFSGVTAAVLLGSIGVKLWLAVFNKGLGRHIDSQALMAAAADSRNDAVSTGAVLVAAVVEHFTHWKVDGFVGLGVALFILYSGAMLARKTISPLLGEKASPQLRRRIIDTVRSDERVLGYHDLMVHDYGPGQRFASVHVEMDQREDPLLCHEIIDHLERTCLRRHNIHLVIHYDPVAVGDAAVDEMRNFVNTVLAGQDPRLTVHDFRMVRGEGYTNLIFDVALPETLKGRQKQLKKDVEKALEQLHQGTYYTVITFDPEGFNEP